MGTDLPLRADLSSALEGFWASLDREGEFLTARQRISVAAGTRGGSETRPSSDIERLPVALEKALELMVSKAWEMEEATYDALVGGGADQVSPGQFVEMLAVAAMTISTDTFDLARGQPRRPLPRAPLPESTRKPRGLLDPLCQAKFNSWVPVVPPLAARPGTKVFESYFEGRGASLGPEKTARLAKVFGNIPTQLSSCPEDHALWQAMDAAMYIPESSVRPDLEPKNLLMSRAQIEVLATEVSLANQCGY